MSAKPSPAASTDAANRIQSTFGLPIESLMEVVDCMVLARNSYTENDAPGAGGLRSYLDGTRRLREVGCMHAGWERHSDHNIPTIFNPQRGIRIAVCNTDDGTGSENTHPQNRSKKGAATEWAVSETQMTLGITLNGTVIDFSRTPNGIQNWYLCVFVKGDTIRAELSCPSSIENGFFCGFHERIILCGTESGNASMVTRIGEEIVDLEINVTRKQRA